MRCVLAELPETLDETYEQIQEEIPRVNQEHTHQLLQCLTVAVHPLRVQEPAEVLAIDLNAAGGMLEKQVARERENRWDCWLEVSKCASFPVSRYRTIHATLDIHTSARK